MTNRANSIACLATRANEYANREAIAGDCAESQGKRAAWTLERAATPAQPPLTSAAMAAYAGVMATETGTPDADTFDKSADSADWTLDGLAGDDTLIGGS